MFKGKIRDDSQDSGTGQQQQDEGNSSRMVSGCNGIQQETKEEEQKQAQDEVGVGRRDMSL